MHLFIEIEFTNKLYIVKIISLSYISQSFGFAKQWLAWNQSMSVLEAYHSSGSVAIILKDGSLCSQ